MPPNPTPMPWCLRRWTIAATRRHESSSAKRSILRPATSFSTPTINRARAESSFPIAGPRWFFTGIIATARCAPKGRLNCCRTRKTTPIFTPEHGRAGSAPGPANKAGRSSRGRLSRTRWPARRADSASPMAGRALPNPTMSRWMYRGRLTGADFACIRRLWSCGWKASFASMIVRAGRAP